MITQKPSRRRRLAVAGVTLLLVGSVAVAWWWIHRAPTRPDPPMPRDIKDPKVRVAIEMARQRVIENPNAADAWGDLGLTLNAHLCFEEADRCFAEASQLDPSEATWPYLRAILAPRLYRNDAMPLLRAAVEADSSRPEEQSALRLQLAEELLEQQELNEAERLFRKEWHAQPNNLRAALGLGLIAVAREDEKSAVQFLSAARVSPCARKTATVELAALARARGEHTTADKYEKEAAALPRDLGWPDPFLLRVSRAKVGFLHERDEALRFAQMGRFKEAAQIYLGLLEWDRSAVTCVSAGLNLARIGQFDRAMPLLLEGVQRDPENPNGHFRLAEAFYMRAEGERQRSQDSSRAREWYGNAAKAAQRATELQPTHAGAYLMCGRARMHCGEVKEAIALLRSGVACRPEDFNLQLTLGQALLEVGQLQDAEIHLENARKLNPKDPRPGQALERLRQKKG
jgi:tetratricopeptide (TPR) repeat protein